MTKKERITELEKRVAELEREVQYLRCVPYRPYPYDPYPNLPYPPSPWTCDAPEIPKTWVGDGTYTGDFPHGNS